ncbi:hypothetical protein PIB30_076218 [Stylosanthes scabra]|uniref:Uncharacterized protein n=1 Tax=Stylosanthes scabra TaxID=79078 RepID=A0ABU6RQH8_9FABA|nr:hypothetical protein [Stylosanthes scabra]
MHMLAVLRICVGLGARKNEEVTFALLNVSLERAFYAYAWIFYACAWMNEASGGLGHVWACLDVTLERELLASHAYAWTSTPMRGKGKPRCYA